MIEKQYIGLDIGTNSVGWAVTNEKYEVVKAKGKLLYGSRIFSEASDASSRRVFRTNRRRMQRRKERIALLEAIFSDSVSKVDFEFFQRLKESAYYDGDKSVKGDFSLFNDADYTDRNFYAQYPTIYHLRKAMIESDRKFDIRLIYLVAHHIVKYRGNFLMEGQNLNNKGQEDNSYIVNLFKQINEYYEKYDINLNYNLSNVGDFVNLILNSKGINKLTKDFNELFDAKENLAKSISKILAGGSLKVSALFPMFDLEGMDPDAIKFSKSGFEDDDLPKIISALDEDSKIVQILFNIYSWMQYKRILNGNTYYSFAMVKRYDDYKNDLLDLKSIYHKYLTAADYNAMFRVAEEKANNYSSYNRGTQYKNEKHYVKGCKYEDFISFLKKELEKNKDKLTVSRIDDAGNSIVENREEYQRILDRISEGEFLKKIVTSDNGVLPYQLNAIELQIILDKQAKYYDFLNKKEDGLTVKEKIIKLLTFRIPYYVGPLNDAHKKSENNGFAWVVRTKRGKVTPWNFDEMVDRDQSENMFINSMTNKCTYLPMEDVLPKQSLIYQEYMVLTELNNLKLNNERLDVNTKQRIFNELFSKCKKVTIKKLKDWFVNSGIKTKSEVENLEISGLADGFKSSLSTYIDFSNILGDFDMNSMDMVEEIVKWIVISPDKTRVERRIKKFYREELSDDQIDKITHITLSGWGRFSKKLLNSEEISYKDPITGVNRSIINLLYNYNLNLMEIFENNVFKIREVIEKYNENLVDDENKISYDDIENLPVSPTVKRPVNQSLKIIREIKKITKREPDKIFIEVTREHMEDKKTPSSRKDSLLASLNSVKDDCDNYNTLMEELNKSEVSRLRQDKLYLYFTQLGKDMYSGEPIDIEELSSQRYDIDHIYPQSLIKDDSLNNRVLVSKESNANKLDVYPIDEPIRNKMIPFWRMLKTKGIISVEKYNRLTRSEGLSAEEIASFVNKQIVSTSQATKAVINLLSHEYPNAKMVWAKASHVSDFRRDNNMYKSREANDYHHAKDAYLNVVVGNVFDTKYTVNSAIAIAKMKISDTKFSINPDRIYNSDIPGAWSIDSGSKSIDIVRKYMNYNNVLFTVMPTMKKGQLFDQNILPKGKSDVLIPLKEKCKLGNTQKYGGYNKLGIAYYFLVESLNKKGEPQRSIESMPIMYYKKFEEDPSFAQHLLTDYFKLKSPKILVSKILVNSPIKRKNTMCRITGKTGDRLLLAINLQWNVDQETLNYLHLLEKYRDRQKKKKTFDAKHPEDKNLEELEINSLYSQNSKSNVKPQIISKKTNIELYEKVQNQLNKEIYNGISLDSPKTIVRDGKEKFIALDVKSQVIVIFEILKLLSCGSEHSNLVLIDGPANCGSLLMSKNISKDEDLQIINQSITGVYESVRFSNLEVK